MTGTALVLPAGKVPAHIQARAVTGASEFTSGISGGGLSLPKLSFRGKVWRLKKGGEEAKIGTQALEMLVVAARPHTSKAYYDKPWDPNADITAPRCFAPDGNTPQGVGGEAIASSCSVCPKNQWGSAVRNGVAGKGKACADSRRILVWVKLPSGDLLGQPVVLDLPATSIKAKRGEQPAFFEFARAIEQSGFPVYSMWATVSFEDDSEYPRLVFRPLRWADEDEVARAEEMREEDDTLEALSTEAEVVAPAAAPVAQPTKAPEVALPPREEAKPAAKPKAKAAPAPEPEPEPAPAAQETDDETLAAVRKLLGA